MRALKGLFARQPEHAQRCLGDVFLHGEVREQVELLKHHAHAMNHRGLGRAWPVPASLARRYAFTGHFDAAVLIVFQALDQP
ncbi:hypothetical protein ALP75_205182 [Pseudomonas syringae pv. actinidiae]|nr:hypothetical protein ALP75_205182 [Pseudomonas syringae pv. actinidiae]